MIMTNFSKQMPHISSHIISYFTETANRNIWRASYRAAIPYELIFSREWQTSATSVVLVHHGHDPLTLTVISLDLYNLEIMKSHAA